MSESFSQTELPQLRLAVQQNCHIADAVHAGDYTLCVYLLKMREFYRWESGFGFNDKLEKQAIGEWLRAREQLWEQLEATDYLKLVINNREFDPFETDEINLALKPHGLVYSGGLGINTKPHFFLGQLHDQHELDEYTVYVSGSEYARDLSAPPAMSLGKTIFIRRESLKRMMWERLEEWRWNEPENAMAKALSHYPFHDDLDASLEQMTENELQNVLLHEIGEVKAGKVLGSYWETMLSELPHSKAELMLRAVRDHLADSLSTLPHLLENQQSASLHFYIANLNSLRKYLYPSIMSAYKKWQTHDDITPLQQQIQQGYAHWLKVANQALELYRQDGLNAKNAIEDYLESQRL